MIYLRGTFEFLKGLENQMEFLDLKVELLTFDPTCYFVYFCYSNYPIFATFIIPPIFSSMPAYLLFLFIISILKIHLVTQVPSVKNVSPLKMPLDSVKDHSFL